MGNRGALVILLCLGGVPFACSNSLLDWVGLSGGEAPVEEEVRINADGIPLIDVPFEELSPEEKFLVEASKITGLSLSQMDVCQHKILMKLKTSCGSLSEEQLARLSVNLLNCQLSAEGKKEYPCTDQMGLNECTKDMDKDVWYTYHVISNRARAVCYAARQQQFRALSELTVNKLVSAARQHVNTLNSLQGAQEKLEGISTRVLTQLKHGSKEVLASNNAVLKTQETVVERMGKNYQQLLDESALVENLTKSFTQVLNILGSKLDSASKQIVHNSQLRQEDHALLVKDIRSLTGSVLEIMSKIDDSAKAVVRERKASKLHFDETLLALREINSSVAYISSLVESLRFQADSKLTYLTDFVGENGENLEKNISQLAHLMALLLCMVFSSFLQVPHWARWLILIVAPLNGYVCFYTDYSRFCLCIDRLYMGFVVIILVDLLTRFLLSLYRKSNPSLSNGSETLEPKIRENGRVPVGEESHVEETFDKVSDWLKAKNRDKTPFNGYLRTGTSNFMSTRRFSNAVEETGEDKENRSVASSSVSRSRRRTLAERGLPATPSLSVAGSATSGNKTPCTAICKNGLPCRNTSLSTTLLYCRIHAR